MPLSSHVLPIPYPAYILAAGTSRRFGSNKAFAHWQGIPFLNYQLQLLQSYFATVKVIAPTPHAYRGLGVEDALVDRFPGRGPLAGLDAALQDPSVRSDAWLFLASCDTFGVQAEDILGLAKELPRATGKYQAVLWRHTGGLEPLWGFYSTGLASAVYERLCEGRLAMQQLLKAIEVNACDRNRDWIQINAPSDFPEEG